MIVKNKDLMKLKSKKKKRIKSQMIKLKRTKQVHLIIKKKDKNINKNRITKFMKI